MRPNNYIDWNLGKVIEWIIFRDDADLNKFNITKNINNFEFVINQSIKDRNLGDYQTLVTIKADVISRLRQGKITATGIRKGSLKRVIIPPEFWADASFSTMPLQVLNGNYSEVWDDLLFEESSIKKHFANFSLDRRTPQSHKCKQWLEETMKNTDKNKKLTKDAYQKKAKEKFNVSVRPFNDIWRNLAPTYGWNKPGRTRKTNT